MTPEQKFVAALLEPLADLETALVQLIVGRRVSNAQGVTLTTLGRLVGQQRLGGVDEETFRRYVNARIAVSRSNGVEEDLITVAVLVVGDPTITFTFINRGRGSYTLRVDQPITASVASTLHSLVQQATAAGVRLVLEYGVSPAFRFDSGPGFDLGHLAGQIG